MAGGIREQHGDELSENHEINVTPFIDVMLVLLIIFMVAAPLATVDVNVDLPASTAKPAERPDEPLYLTVKEDLSLNIGNDSVQREQLAATLDRVTEGKKDTRVFLRADKAVDYGQFMEVMNLLRDSGYLKIALVGLETLPGPPAPAAAPAGGVPAVVPPAAPATPAPGGNP
ncbi:TonB system transport protein ExbD [Neorhizobium galegae]|uniref:Biopolymer transport protein ExbD n=2 Tax=Neorhizobium galegae TaxID=399 RepID=A0A068SXA1_NEOGA|nr:TonB system transport protein ExbD [Neorhizobium galegae]KAB1089024.1 TonB system transport protein ExbD [Neorhizobium galegae]MCQ1851746.1 TonB system transport protein ExbD [Neorhizobium galegae]CDN50406.1 Biopolymer transport protein ExbD [Neorhizobium galegae bv. orientalis str. HAMBI 540]